MLIIIKRSKNIHNKKYKGIYKVINLLIKL